MKKLHMVILGLVSLVAVGVLASCASSQDDAEISSAMAQASPEGSWVLAELPGADTIIPTEITLDLSVEDESLRASGFSGVNRYSGSATVIESSGDFSFGMMISTKMAGPHMAFEDAYLRVLAEVDRYRLADSYLFLYTNGELVAVYQAS